MYAAPVAIQLVPDLNISYFIAELRKLQFRLISGSSFLIFYKFIMLNTCETIKLFPIIHFVF